MTDIDVLRRVRAGNTKAYEELILKYEKRIFHVAMGLLQNEQDAMDATQEVFIKAFMRVENFREDSEYYTYLFRITVNECKDMLARRARQRTVPLYDEDDAPLEIPSPQEGPVELAQADELKQAMYEQMLALEEPFRQTLLLRSIYDMSYEQIAAETDSDIGTVKSRIFRSREKIRRNLAERNLL